LRCIRAAVPEALKGAEGEERVGSLPPVQVTRGGAGNEAADQEAGLEQVPSIDCRRAGAPTTVNFCDGQRARLCVVLDWAGEAVLAPQGQPSGEAGGKRKDEHCHLGMPQEAIGV
jgi:hypothetical protein